MNRQHLLRLIGFSVATLLVLAGVTTVMGQGPDPSVTPEPIEDSPGGLAAAGEISIAAQAPFTLNYQGFLTDGSGTPLQGTQTLTFTLHDAQTLGAQVWGPETHTTNLVNGLFSLVLGETQALTPAIFNQALFLQINVNGVSLARQPLRPVAYAFGLVPGAEVKGNTNRNRRRGVAEVVHEVGEKRDRTRRDEDRRLHESSDAEDREADENGADAGTRAHDRAIDETVRVPVCSTVMASLVVVCVVTRVFPMT
jgi:hypothetical protein